MKIVIRFVFFVFGAMLALLSPVISAHAEDKVDQAISALRSTRVYVAQGTERTTKTTASELTSKLNEDDHIVIVMFPGDATTASAEDVAARILGSLKESSTLGLYINGQTVAYSTRLPMDVIPDLMNRANSISRTPQESLTVFVALVHEYQTAHPEPTPTPSGETTKPTVSPSDFTWLIILGCVAAISTIVLLIWRHMRDPYPVRHTPAPVSEQLYKIRRLMDDIQSSEMTHLMGDIIKDTGAFFKRAKGINEVDTQGFAKRLRTAVELVEKYIEIQNEPRYAPNPPGADALLHSGRIAIKGLSESVLKAVRDESAVAVLDFQIKADLLTADISIDYR